MGGGIQDAGDAPHLDIRPATDEERQVLKTDIINTESVHQVEQKIISYSVGNFAKEHLEEVSKIRIAEIEKIESEVHKRLVHVLNYWDLQASKQKEKSKQKFQYAQKQAANYSCRLQVREAQLKRAKKISALTPIIRTRMLVIPSSFIRGEIDRTQQDTSQNQDIAKKKEYEELAMEAVMEQERSLGFRPQDVSKENLGYDIFSIDPKTKNHRYIEVKGRSGDARTITVTRNEAKVALENPDKYILAIVYLSDGKPNEPRYVHRPFKNDSVFDTSFFFNIASVQLDLKRLLEFSEIPQ